MNSGALSPTFNALFAAPEAISSAVARSITGWISAGALYGGLPALKSALKASSRACRDMVVILVEEAGLAGINVDRGARSAERRLEA